jgi:hypothetical protein
MRRFPWPVCHQGLPATLLPKPVLDDNPSGRQRRFDGEWSRESLPC